MIEILGIAGGAAFAFAAVPAAVVTFRKGGSTGTPVSIAWAIFAGCILLYSYLTAKHGFDLILAAVYGVETASWSVILWFHYFPTSELHFSRQTTLPDSE
jgi:hypothetical protein